MVQVLGWVLIVLGVVGIMLGLIFGAKKAFQKQADGAAQGVIPTAFWDVIKKLLEAPSEKFFFVGGLVLIVIGLVLIGVDVFPKVTVSTGASSVVTT